MRFYASVFRDMWSKVCSVSPFSLPIARPSILPIRAIDVRRTSRWERVCLPLTSRPIIPRWQTDRGHARTFAGCGERGACEEVDRETLFRSWRLVGTPLPATPRARTVVASRTKRFNQLPWRTYVERQRFAVEMQVRSALKVLHPKIIGGLTKNLFLEGRL